VIEIASITFACADPTRLADFWAAATGYGHVEVSPERLAEIDAVVEPGSWAVLQHPDRVGPRLIFHRRPKSQPEHIPIHLDLAVDDVDAEVERLVALGATVAERKLDPFGAPLVVLRDPEGNGFCVE
jgi:predicted enzyme related to lactoylglutathione lyase